MFSMLKRIEIYDKDKLVGKADIHISDNPSLVSIHNVNNYYTVLWHKDLDYGIVVSKKGE